MAEEKKDDLLKNIGATVARKMIFEKTNFSWQADKPDGSGKVDITINRAKLGAVYSDIRSLLQGSVVASDKDIKQLVESVIFEEIRAALFGR